ncbi:putative Myb domain, Homeobox-like domain superfamily protein [Plasmopara halstedii]
MTDLVSSSDSAPPLSRRTQLFIQNPRVVVDSSDEARTDTATPPSMNPACSPVTDAEGATAVSTKTATNTSSFSGKQKKTDEDKSASKQRKYERKTKRFVWPDDLHRLFVAAIFDVGLKNASPKTLLTLMEPVEPDAGLTTEHLKSHLQKFRLNYERSRIEFLEYYDRSAKRNLKRRRSQGQQRMNGANSETASMFVFPISNPKRRKNRVHESDSGESDSDNEYCSLNDNTMDDGIKKQATSRVQRESSAASTTAHAPDLIYSQLMQSAQQQPIFDGNSQTRQHSHVTDTLMMPVVPALVSTGMMPIKTQHLPPAYAAHVQRKQFTDHDRELAVAAAAVAAYRYPLGQLPVASGTSGMPELSDPQWSLLTSLISPQLSAMNAPVDDDGMFAHGATSDTILRNASEYVFQNESCDLRMQMHIAMQAQMNLHRQMLTRKVEMAQHLASQNRMGRGIDTRTVLSNNDKVGRFCDLLSGPQHLQQFQQQPTKQMSQQRRQLQQQQQQQQQHQQKRQEQHQQWEQQHQQREQQQEQQHQQLKQHQQRLLRDQQNEQFQMPLHSEELSTNLNSTTPEPPTVAGVSEEAVVTGPSPDETMIVSKPKTDKGTLATDNKASGLAAETRSESGDDGLDLYRWDRIDLNVELDDDDLFGFLKS